MTTDQELLARINSEIERLRIARDGLIKEERYTAAAEVSRHLLSWKALRAVVELQLGDDKYPTDIFPELTETDKENLKEVHRLFPNLIGRVDASACRRAFGIAEREVREAITKELG